MKAVLSLGALALLLASAPALAQTIAITDVKLAGADAKSITLVIEDGKISAMGPTVKAPKGATVIAGR